VNWQDDDYDKPTVTVQKRPTFVAPAPVEKPVRYEVLPPSYQVPMVTPSGTTESHTVGSHADRARGFQIVTVPISIAFGVGVAVVGAVGFAVPVFSLSMLLLFWLAFLAWWLCGWALHLLFSADGVALLHTVKGWQYLEREQRARLRRYEGGDK
jgi:hypothetical protein